MTTISAYNTIVETFLNQLVTIFPEDQSIKGKVEEYDQMKAEDERKPMTTISADFAGHEQLVMKHDPKFFWKTKRTPFIGGLHIYKYWNETLPEETKEGIWHYVQTLCVLGSGIQQMSDGMLSRVEEFAQGAAAKISKGEMSMESLQSSLFGEMNSMMREMSKEKGLTEEQAPSMEDIMKQMQQMGGMPGGMMPPGGKMPSMAEIQKMMQGMGLEPKKESKGGVSAKKAKQLARRQKLE